MSTKFYRVRLRNWVSGATTLQDAERYALICGGTVRECEWVDSEAGIERIVTEYDPDCGF